MSDDGYPLEDYQAEVDREQAEAARADDHLEREAEREVPADPEDRLIRPAVESYEKWLGRT